ncbi:MAG: thioredoxin-dependent thiol peroxidase [Euryarchaeota archaeon]|nr:thioredoxin-dependent thiol peroxidase [Euryarchaeota archaeon]
MIEVGKPAPDFTLVADDGRKVSLKDFRGKKVVLYFYPKDDTPGCTTEACGFRDVLPDVSSEGAVVLGVSRDDTDSHVRFKEKYGLNFTLLSDRDANVHRTYGAWGEKVMYGKTVEGVIRSTVLVDEDGRIAKHWPRVKPDGHAAEVLEALAATKG